MMKLWLVTTLALSWLVLAGQVKAQVGTGLPDNRQLQIRSQASMAHAQRLEQRFNLYLQQLGSVYQRTNQRLEIFRTDGKNVAQAAAKLEQARSSLVSAKTKSSAAVASFAAALDQKDKALQARDIALEARNDYFEVHQYLRETIYLLREVQ